MSWIKRLFDLVLSLILGVLLLIPLLILALAVRMSSPGPALYWSDRIGKNNKIFKIKQKKYLIR